MTDEVKNEFELWVSDLDQYLNEDAGAANPNEKQKRILTPEEKKLIAQSEKKFQKYLNYILVAFAFVFAIFFVLYSYNKYYKLNSSDLELTEDQKVYIQDFKAREISVISYFDPSYVEWTSIDLNLLNKDLKQLTKVNNDIKWYIYNDEVAFFDKRDNLSQFVTDNMSSTKNEISNLDKVKSDITKYAFLPKVVDDTISDNELQKAIVSIESIKFFTAINLLWRMSSFVKELSEYLWLSEDKIKLIIDTYMGRWEWDTQRYLSTCYLNPYEKDQWNESCKYIDDFSKFYAYNWISDFDYRNFKKIISFIEQKIEYSELPKLSIILNNLDPRTNNITFSIDINTFDQDEADYFKLNWASSQNSNLHIFIITNLIKLLRESHFILWKNIKISDLKINRRKLKMGDSDFIVNNSVFNFNIPIQNSVEREIYDYVYWK